MTKRHYEMLAAFIRDWLGENCVKGMAHDLAAKLAADNTRFDRTRFLVACGFPKDEHWPGE